MGSMTTHDMNAQTTEILTRLAATIEERRSGDPAESYVAKLAAGGTALIAKKVGEEAVETVLAAASEDQGSVVRESADLIFHLMVLWSHCGIGFNEIAAELERREGTSGLEERRQRTTKS